MQFQSKIKVARAFIEKLLCYADQEWAVVALGYQSVPIAYDMAKALHMPLDMVAPPEFWQPEHILWRQVIAVTDDSSRVETSALLSDLVKNGTTRLILVAPNQIENITEDIKAILEKQYFLEEEGVDLDESAFSLADVNTMLAHK